MVSGPTPRSPGRAAGPLRHPGGRGYAAVLSLGQAEIVAVPDLLVVRCVASVFWRAGRWRRGQSALSDVADRVAVLEASQTWLAVHRGRLLSVLAAAEE
jgi:Ser/Thr protein kinase RdoA (MazF antagonist)